MTESLSFTDARWLAINHGKAIRAPYMSPGWKIVYIKAGKGLFNINPHTGSDYQFTPQKIDFDSKWSVVQ